MPNIARLLRKDFSILSFRLRTQGLLTTLVWAFGRGLPALTGVPLLRFSAVTPQLYVGPQYRAAGKHLLERQGFTHCVNLRIELDDAAEGLALTQYLRLPVVDDEAPTFDQLDEGVAFIRAAMESGGKVYIHCGAGVGRAPTMAAAYLVAEGCTLDEALAKIRRVRPFITITPPQMEQLRAYAARRFAERAAS